MTFRTITARSAVRAGCHHRAGPALVRAFAGRAIAAESRSAGRARRAVFRLHAAWTVTTGRTLPVMPRALAHPLAELARGKRRRWPLPLHRGTRTWMVEIKWRRTAEARAAESGLRTWRGHRHDFLPNLHRDFFLLASSLDGEHDFIALFAGANQSLQLLHVDDLLIVEHRDHIILLEPGVLCRAVRHHIADEHTETRWQTGLRTDFRRHGAQGNADERRGLALRPAGLFAMTRSTARRRTTPLARAVAFGFRFSRTARLGWFGWLDGFGSRLGFLRVCAQRPEGERACGRDQSCEVRFHESMGVGVEGRIGKTKRRIIGTRPAARRCLHEGARRRSWRHRADPPTRGARATQPAGGVPAVFDH